MSTAKAQQATADSGTPFDLVVITGMAGAGKSIALHALEDAGYYCVDNLPPELLLELVQLERQQHKVEKVAIAVDARTANSLPLLAPALEQLRSQGVSIRQIFLDASTDVLVRRFSETRRRHPLSDTANTGSSADRISLHQAIERERSALQGMRDMVGVHLIDTSLIRSAQLQTHIKSLINTAANSLTVVLQSFAFKRGLPLDANFVFDVRMLPNPYYEPALRPLTGCDAPVAQFLAAQEAVQNMSAQIGNFMLGWLPDMAYEHRSYVTIAIGCTGGQHRSVYIVEQLYQKISPYWACLKRHRELDLPPAPASDSSSL